MHDLLAPSPAVPRGAASRTRHDGPPTIAGLLARLLIWLAAVLRWHARQSERRREAASIRRALGALDPAELHDLGLDASEIESVAAEMTGTADVTRSRVAQSRARVAPRH